MKLRSKMLLGVLGAASLVFVVIIAAVIWRVSAVTRTAARENLQSAAVAAGGVARANLMSIMSMTKSFAWAVSEVRPEPESARGEIVGMAENFLRNNPEVTSTWVIFELNAFDGKDAEYVNRQGFNDAGRMIVILSRENGKIVKTLEGIDEATVATFEDYHRTRIRNRDTVFEPYFYSYTGGEEGNVLITAMGVPIRKNGKPVGVAGVDIALDLVNRQLQSIALPEGAQSAFYSNGGIIVSEANTADIGRTVSDIGLQNPQKVLETIRNGNSDFFVTPAVKGQSEEMAFCYEPIFIGDQDAPWAFSLSIPTAVVDRTARQLAYQIALSAFVGSVLLGIVVVLLVRRIVDPIAATSLTLTRLGELDLRNANESGISDVEALEKNRDEIGVMTRALRSLRQAVADMVRTLNSESDNIAQSADQLSGLSGQSAAAIGYVRESIDRVLSLSESNADNMRMINQGAEGISQTASNSAQMVVDVANKACQTSNLNENAVKNVDQVVTEMRALSEETVRCDESLRHLTESVESIADFATLISNIADQTNLLALNAAIESARAGDAGRGFAVVSEEVRGLAEESNAAAKKVAELAGLLKGEAEKSREIFSKVQDRLQHVGKDAQDVMSSLRQAQEEVGDISGHIQGIAAISEEQASSSAEVMEKVECVTNASEEIRKAIEAIRISTAETHDVSEQVEMESRSLAGGADKLRNLLAQFRVSARES